MQIQKALHDPLSLLNAVFMNMIRAEFIRLIIREGKLHVICVGRDVCLRISTSLVIREKKRKLFLLSVITFATRLPSSHTHRINICFTPIYTLIFHTQTIS